MDAEDYNTDGLGNVSEVVTHVKKIRKARNGRHQHEAGRRGRIYQPRGPQGGDEVRFPGTLALTAVTVGYKNTGEIDEAIENLNLALA